MARQLPGYVLAPGIARPGHWASDLPQQIDADGNRVFGFVPQGAELSQAAGYKVAPFAGLPEDLRRLYVAPSLAIEIEGRRWLVPQLIGADGLIEPHLVHEHLVLGPAGRELERVVEHEELLRRLRPFVLRVIDNAPIDVAEFYELAAEVLAINYHVALDDAAAWGWASNEWAVAVLQAACGLYVMSDEALFDDEH